MVKRFLGRFRRKGMKPEDLLKANFAEIKRFEEAVRTRAAAMTTILQLTGWTAAQANKVIGASYYTERTESGNSRADPDNEVDSPDPDR